MPSIATRLGFVALLLSGIAVVWLAQRSAGELHRFRSVDPTVWEPAIAGFERAAAAHPPSPDAVLFIGASTIRFWSTLDEDVAPLEAVARGFGGAKLGDVSHYADRLVAPPPRAIVVAVGGNDLFEMAGSNASGEDEVIRGTRALLERFHALVPDAAIYTVAIRPPILDAQGRDPSSRVNAGVASFAEKTAWLHYIDPNDGLYGDDGILRGEYQEWDSSQLSREGYRAWSAPIRDRLLRDLGGSATAGSDQRVNEGHETRD